MGETLVWHCYVAKQNNKSQWDNPCRGNAERLPGLERSPARKDGNSVAMYVLSY